MTPAATFVSAAAADRSSKSAAIDYARDCAFLWCSPPPITGLPERLLDASGLPYGPPLAPLTPWRHNLLLVYGSPYLTGGTCRRRHLWQALYLCSPAFRAGSSWRFLCYRLRTFFFVALKFQAASRSLATWMDAAMSFMPGAPVEKLGQGNAQWAADRPYLVSIMQMGRKMGFPPLETVHLPYALLWSNLAAELDVSAPDRPKFNRARDKALGEHLRRRAAKMKN